MLREMPSDACWSARPYVVLVMFVAGISRCLLYSATANRVIEKAKKIRVRNLTRLVQLRCWLQPQHFWTMNLAAL